MTFGFLVGIATLLVVAIEALLAWREGTLTRRGRATPQLSFLLHGAMWADALLLPFVNASLVPHLEWRASLIAWVVLLGVAVTALAHELWSRDPVRDPFWPAGRTLPWWRGLRVVGWLHAAFLTVQVALLALALGSAIPAPVATRVALLLTCFTVVAVLQPPLALRRRLAGADVGVCLAMLVAVFGWWWIAR